MNKNYIFMFLSHIVRILSNVVIFLILARVWGAETFGEFMYPFTFSLILIKVIDYGFVLQLVKHLSKDSKDTDDVVNSYFNAKVYIFLFMFLLVLLTLPIYNGTNNLVFILLFLSLSLSSFSQFIGLPFRALDKFQLETLNLFLGNLLLFIVVIILVILDFGIVGIAFGYFISAILSMLMGLYLYNTKLGRLKVGRVYTKKSMVILKEGFPYAIHLFMGALYLQVDTIFINYFMESRDVGIYQSAMRVVLGSLILSEVIASVYLPQISRMLNKEQIIKHSITINSRTVLLGGFVSIAILLLAKIIVFILFGESFNDAIPLLQVFAILIFIRFIGTVYGVVLTISDKQSIRATISTVAFFINIILNYYLIPTNGLEGAAIASIITSFMLVVFYIYFAWKELGHFLFTKKILALILIFSLVFFYLLF
jgi:O-antigen/teichoic acid export membrane protein